MGSSRSRTVSAAYLSASDVLCHQVRVGGQNFGFWHSIRHHSNHSGDRNPQAADARYAAHLIRIDSYAFKSHVEDNIMAQSRFHSLGEIAIRSPYNRRMLSILPECQ